MRYQADDEFRNKKRNILLEIENHFISFVCLSVHLTLCSSTNFFFASIHDEWKQKLILSLCWRLYNVDIFIYKYEWLCILNPNVVVSSKEHTLTKYQHKRRHSHTLTKQSYRVYRLIKSFALKSVARKSEAHFQSNYSIDSLMFCFVNNNFCTLLLWVNILKGNASLNTVWFFLGWNARTHTYREKRKFQQ